MRPALLASTVRLAVNILLRRKFYTFVSLFGISFTLLILMLCTALLTEVMAPGAPETRLDRILGVEWARIAGPTNDRTSNPGFALLDRHARDLPGVEKISIVRQQQTVTSFVDGEKVESRLRRVDAAFWSIMEFDFVAGGPFTVEDAEQGSFVAVVGERTADVLLGPDRSLGETIRADGQSFAVVGIVRDVPLTRRFSHADIWVPHRTAKRSTYRERLVGGFVGVLLAEDRSRFPEIKETFAERLSRAEITDPRFDTLESVALTRFEEFARDVFSRDGQAPTGRLAAVISSISLAFMLLPALNLVNLNLSRILERSSEIGVRKAFGASSSNLVGQFLAENVLLTLVGGALGLGLTYFTLWRIEVSEVIPHADFEPNWRVFAAALVLSLVFGVLSGAYPAWRMSRLHPVDALHGRT